MLNGTVIFIKNKSFSCKIPLSQLKLTYLHALDKSHLLIPGGMSDISTLVSLGRYCLGDGYDRSFMLLLLSYFTNKSYLCNWCCVLFRSSYTFLVKRGLCGIRLIHVKQLV